MSSHIGRGFERPTGMRDIGRKFERWAVVCIIASVVLGCGSFVFMVWVICKALAHFGII